MKTPAWYVFKDFLDQEPLKSSLLRFLSPHLVEIVEQSPSLPFHPSQGIASYKDRLQGIHYSWILPLLEPYSDADKYLFLSILDHKQQEPLLQHFDLSKQTSPLSLWAELFLSKHLYELLTQDHKNLLPKECLPEDPLNFLLDLSRERLLHLVDLLSLHDLALEMRNIINSSHLMKINALLSQDQKNYLFQLRQRIEPIAFKPMGLNHWNGDESLLKKLLHERGLNRLSKALSFSHLSLLWHLSHKLDIGRASIVKTLFKELKNKKAHTLLVSQVCESLQGL
ncbi:MAG: hypothetical protein FJZ63_01395 [Chlamydiae bacterium]|nr:hypothetical protein [Chlamydiota bacterium]